MLGVSMKVKIMANIKWLGLVSAIVFSNNSLAQWFESTGHATVKNGDTSQAKSAAIKDATTNGNKKNRVSFVQNLIDGILH